MQTNVPIWGHHQDFGYIFASSNAEINNLNELLETYQSSFREPNLWISWEEYWNLRFDVLNISKHILFFKSRFIVQ